MSACQQAVERCKDTTGRMPSRNSVTLDVSHPISVNRSRVERVFRLNSEIALAVCHTTLRTSQTTRQITIMVPTNPKPSILFLLLIPTRLLRHEDGRTSDEGAVLMLFTATRELRPYAGNDIWSCDQVWLWKGKNSGRSQVSLTASPSVCT